MTHALADQSVTIEWSRICDDFARKHLRGS